MAGDWIKMRTDLADDPAVVSIAARLDMEEALVVGKLHRLWSWADKHTTDGRITGITYRWLDRYIATPGFADAMAAVGWLIQDGEFVVFPNFDRHNGESAKRRCGNTLRARSSRFSRAFVAPKSTISRTLVAQVFARDAGTCVYCGCRRGDRSPQSGPISFSVDHVTPESRGGKTIVENLVTCCLPCNLEKSNRTPEDAGMPLAHLQDGLEYVDQRVISVAQTSRKLRDKSATREEKRREEKNTKGGKPPLNPPVTADAIAYPEGMDTPEVRMAVAEWIDHHKAIQKPYRKSSAIEKALRRFVAGGPAAFVAAVNYSIGCNYQGLFAPEKESKHGSGPAHNARGKYEAPGAGVF